MSITDRSGGGAEAPTEDAPPQEAPEHDAHRLRNGLVWVVVLGLLLFGIAMAVPGLRDVLERASDASPAWLALGIVLEVGSCLGYVAVVRLVLHRGPPPEVRRLAWAEQAFGAVLGAGGVGSLALGAWALRAWGLPWSRVANRSAVIFLLTSAVNVVVLGLAGIGVWVGIGTDRSGAVSGLLPGGLALAGLALFLTFPLVKAPGEGHLRARRVRVTLHGLGVYVRDTEALLSAPSWRVLGAPAYLLCDIAVLWACLQAVGVSPPILALVVGYQIGYVANAIPVPGGIGVLEGGLTAALVLYGLPVTQTAAAVILYHAIALWVPTIGGTIAFAGLRRAITHRTAVRAEPRDAVPAPRPVSVKPSAPPTRETTLR